MAKRKCASCGESKEVRGGKVCENDHFVCSECVHGSGVVQVLLGPSRSSCPLCSTKLR